ncbi:MAG: DUF111 family protein, partial [Tissierellia bacterium]|nr:DUF111 family protein [Tissierellia bacterium]
MRVLYFDAFAGISGNMTLAALLGLGIDRDWFQEELKKLNLGNVEFAFTEVSKHGIAGLHIEVLLDGQPVEEQE